MKNIKLTILLILSTIFCIDAQTTVNDSVILGMDYQNQSYYKLASGETANVSGTNWDLAFNTYFMSASIRVNSGNGVQLFNLQNNDTGQWSNIDTVGMSPIYDSDTSWEIGAFNAFATGHPNYGWGAYENLGFLKGLKVFVIKLSDGSYKKIWIKNLNGLIYTVAIGDLDNTNEFQFTLNKGTYDTKAFVYYSIDNEQIIDPEPIVEEWDLVFRRYLVNVAPGLQYQITGVLNNPNVTAHESRGIAIDEASPSGTSFATNISTIGHDWKNFNMNTFMWELEDSLSYFVLDQTGDIYHLAFTGFEGQATGKIFFSKTLIGQPTAIEDIATGLTDVAVFPNPVSNYFNVLLNSETSELVTVTIADMAGRKIYDQSRQLSPGLNNLRFDPTDYAPGNYIIQVISGDQRIYRKVMKI